MNQEAADHNTVPTDESDQMSYILLGVKHLRQAPGRRRYVRHGGSVCSACLIRPPTLGRRYCNQCEADCTRRRRLAKAGPQ
jgi:hypothetical protein